CETARKASSGCPRRELACRFSVYDTAPPGASALSLHDALPISRGDHVGDPFAAPRRDPTHALDLGERAAAEVAALHADEPLLRGTEDDRVLAAPAVRVAVHEALGGEERARGAQALDDARVRLEHAHPRPFRHLGREPSMRV